MRMGGWSIDEKTFSSGDKAKFKADALNSRLVSLEDENGKFFHFVSIPSLVLYLGKDSQGNEIFEGDVIMLRGKAYYVFDAAARQIKDASKIDTLLLCIPVKNPKLDNVSLELPKSLENAAFVNRSLKNLSILTTLGKTI